MATTANKAAAPRVGSLDPVTFEVLKNGFETLVEEMGEQILRTCFSFVIYSRDFSCALFDRSGELVMQGREDAACHVGTLAFTAKSVINKFEGDINEGDVFITNDPYLGGTHFNDVCVLRPIFFKGELLAFAQSKGHWADMGGSVPGSFDIKARHHFSEGLRITPIRLWTRGVFLSDIAEMLVANTRHPRDARGDMHAQAEATRVAEREFLRLAARYGGDVIVEAMAGVQEYSERLARLAIAELPDGVWETEDWIDFNPEEGDGYVPIKVKLEIRGDQVHYDLTGSHPALPTFLNSSFGATTSALYAGTKTFFPELPMNAGFHRVVNVDCGPQGSVVNAVWPSATAGFCAGPHEKLMMCAFELWSAVKPERAIAAAYNIEYLLVGGRDQRVEGAPFFMWYDWMAGGWGGRNGRDGFNATCPTFSVALATQPIEGQERLAPVIMTEHELVTDSGGPGRFRGGSGVQKGAELTSAARETVVSYSSDRARAVTWGIAGGLPSMPQGVWLNRGTPTERYLGIIFSNEKLTPGDVLWRPSAGGGGYGDPLERDPGAVCDDVADGYVSIRRAREDYGVVVEEVDPDLAEFRVDLDATRAARAEIASHRRAWLKTPAEEVAERYRAGELDALDLVRRYGVILDWGTGDLLPKSTEAFREMLRRRAVAHWHYAGPVVGSQSVQ